MSDISRGSLKMTESSEAESGMDQERSTARTGTHAARPRLLHYTSQPITALESRRQDDVFNPRRRPDKPWGLWVSVEGEDDWRSWCEGESFGNPSAQLCYEVALAGNANLLRLKSARELLAFNKDYGFDPYAGRLSFAGSGIQWDRVAEKYDGIIIAPYIWSLRRDDRIGWYYSWDCASGCIWNARAVGALELVVDPSRSTPESTAVASA